MSLLPRASASILTSFLLALSIAAPVLAHAELVSSDPEDKAVLSTAPTTVTLRFSEALDPDKSSFKLIGPGGTIGTGRVADRPRVMVLDDVALEPGDYVIQWTSAADDGHIERGTLTFTVLEPTPSPETPLPPSPTPGGTNEPATIVPATEQPSPTEPPAPTQPVSPSPTPGDAAPAAATGDVVLPIAAGLLLVAGIGLLVLRRSRRT